MKHRVIAAAEFKAKCLALFDGIEEEGGTITVTKRGHPVATISQVKQPAFRDPAGILAGKVKITGNIVNFETTDLWAALKN